MGTFFSSLADPSSSSTRFKSLIVNRVSYYTSSLCTSRGITLHRDNRLTPPAPSYPSNLLTPLLTSRKRYTCCEVLFYTYDRLWHIILLSQSYNIIYGDRVASLSMYHHFWTSKHIFILFEAIIVEWYYVENMRQYMIC